MSRDQQPSLARAKTALLPSHRGDTGDDDERQPLLSRHVTAPPVMSRAVRHRAILDRQLSRQVSWMVNIEAVHEDDDEVALDEVALPVAVNSMTTLADMPQLASVKEEDYAIPDESAADASNISRPTILFSAKPEKTPMDILVESFGPDDFGLDESIFRKPNFAPHAMMPLLVINVVVVLTVAVVTMIAQPLLQRKWSNHASAILSAPVGALGVGAVMLLLVNGFMFLSPGYTKPCGKAYDLDRKALSSICKSIGATRWCKMCAAPKSERVHHCSCCNRCVMVMDHHCGLLGNCVGHQNHRFWMALVAYSGMFVLHAELVIACAILSLWPGPTAMGADFKTALFVASFVVLFCFAGFALFVLLGWYGFFSFHVKLILDNYTTIENLERDEGAKSAFDKGGRKNNVASFLFAQRKTFIVKQEAVASL